MPKAKNRILVIDDNEIQLKLLKKYFNQFDCEVETIQKSEDILQKPSFQNYDAVITDMMMPELTGLEILEYIRKKNEAIPVIMMTAHSNITLAVTFLKSGGTDYLEKPIDLDIFRIKVFRAIQERKLIRRVHLSEKTQIQIEEEKFRKQEDSISLFQNLFKPLNTIISTTKESILKIKVLSKDEFKNYFEKVLDESETILNRLQEEMIDENIKVNQLEQKEKIYLAIEINKIIDEIQIIMQHQFKSNISSESFIEFSPQKFNFIIKYILMHLNEFADNSRPIVFENDGNKEFSLNIYYTGLFHFLSDKNPQQSSTNKNFIKFYQVLNSVLNRYQGEVVFKQLRKENSYINIQFSKE